MLSSIYTTWRDRGTATLLQAIGNQLVAGVHSKILRRRFLEKQIHDYRLLIDLQGFDSTQDAHLFLYELMQHYEEDDLLASPAGKLH